MQLSDNYESVLFFSRHKLSYYNVWAAVNARAECWYRKNLLKLRSELQVLTLLKSLLCSFLLFVLRTCEIINFLPLSRDSMHGGHRIS